MISESVLISSPWYERHWLHDQFQSQKALDLPWRHVKSGPAPKKTRCVYFGAAPGYASVRVVGKKSPCVPLGRKNRTSWYSGDFLAQTPRDLQPGGRSEKADRFLNGTRTRAKFFCRKHFFTAEPRSILVCVYAPLALFFQTVRDRLTELGDLIYRRDGRFFVFLNGPGPVPLAHTHAKNASRVADNNSSGSGSPNIKQLLSIFRPARQDLSPSLLHNQPLMIRRFQGEPENRCIVRTPVCVCVDVTNFPWTHTRSLA